MPVEITMPQLSDTMTEGTVVKWLKKEGDKVKAGEKIAEIETDKATMEMEAFEGGTLAHDCGRRRGQRCRSGELIAVLATGKEDRSRSEEANTPAALSEGRGRNRRRWRSSAVPSMAVASSGEIHEPDENKDHGATRENISTEPPQTDDPHDGRLRVSPLARKIAADRGVDLVQDQRFRARTGGSSSRTSITPSQRRRAAKGRSRARFNPQACPFPSQPQRVAAGATQIIPLSKIRQVIANRLQQSKQTIPHFYETVDIDVEDLTKLRGAAEQAARNAEA